MYLYNSLTKEKELLIPRKVGQITFYSCGQTIYEDIHVGNARTYGYWDILVKWLIYSGYQVTHVQNFTDVGHLTDDADSGADKIELASKKRRITPFELVDCQIQKYWKDMDELLIHRPNVSPRATGHILEMIEFIQALIAKKHAYVANGSVYFDITTFSDYGKLSPSFTYLVEDSQVHRLELKSEKRNPQDFALWINAEGTDHIMRWKSPWSAGYPGWHIECSVMAQKYLGETLDLHAGGIDHLALHHPNEIAQSEARTGQKFANIWLHAAFLTINGQKMSKSKGNFYTVREILDKYPPQVIRLFYATGHYRKAIDFTFERLNQAKELLQRIITTIKRIQAVPDGTTDSSMLETAITAFQNEFADALNDDLNTPEAITAIMRFLKIVNSSRNVSKLVVEKSIKSVIERLNILGVNILPLIEKETIINNQDLLDVMLNVRKSLRENKLYPLADYIRNELNKLGYHIEDY